jgi:hypothetical protein
MGDIASSLLVILTEISSLFQLSSDPTLLGLPFDIETKEVERITTLLKARIEP